jgi:hypothetical protein
MYSAAISRVSPFGDRRDIDAASTPVRQQLGKGYNPSHAILPDRRAPIISGLTEWKKIGRGREAVEQELKRRERARSETGRQKR